MKLTKLNTPGLLQFLFYLIFTIFVYLYNNIKKDENFWSIEMEKKHFLGKIRNQTIK